MVEASGQGRPATGERLPDGLPGYELSTQTGFEEDRVGRVYWQRATYSSHRGAQIVRRHYREILQERGWKIVRNDPIREGSALVVARRGDKEVTVRITPRTKGVDISVLVSEVRIASPTPEPERSSSRPRQTDPSSQRVTRTVRTPAPRATPRRTVTRPRPDRPRQEPDRPRPRPTQRPKPKPTPKPSKPAPRPDPGPRPGGDDDGDHHWWDRDRDRDRWRIDWDRWTRERDQWRQWWDRRDRDDRRDGRRWSWRRRWHDHD